MIKFSNRYILLEIMRSTSAQDTPFFLYEIHKQNCFKLNIAGIFSELKNSLLLPNIKMNYELRITNYE